MSVNRCISFHFMSILFLLVHMVWFKLKMLSGTALVETFVLGDFFIDFATFLSLQEFLLSLYTPQLASCHNFELQWILSDYQRGLQARFDIPNERNLPKRHARVEFSVNDSWVLLRVIQTLQQVCRHCNCRTEISKRCFIVLEVIYSAEN